ncbi:MAG TPA: hypothetical protein VJT73_12250, partial [Polyangiaceae bacterium]|nr:hypothetical protein [Polyangiaceae bacterium]
CVMSAAICACAMASVSNAHAEPNEGPRTPTGPNTDLIGIGIFTIAVPYFASVGVAITSNDQDKLMIPVAGPWMSLYDRPSCGSKYAPCGEMEDFYKFLLVSDGILQGIGALEVLAGLASPAPSSSQTAAVKPTGPTVRVAPTMVGRSGYGLGAVGTF